MGEPYDDAPGSSVVHAQHDVPASVDQHVVGRSFDRGERRRIARYRVRECGQSAMQREPTAGKRADQRGVPSELRAARDIDLAQSVNRAVSNRGASGTIESAQHIAPRHGLRHRRVERKSDYGYKDRQL
ncbi:MAG: hypothetical protein JO079_08825 [Frankiaceae bacterium]|nr:hypothetical protein [Frankiaceae bacterium]MBV9368844.1 hypothetical protein [Frankiales bacterium]